MMQRTTRLAGLLVALAAVPALASELPLSQPPPAPAPWLVAAFSPQAKATPARTARCVRADKAAMQGPVKVGEEVAFAAESPAYAATRAGMNLAWRQEIHSGQASYIAPHFRRFNLPAGAAVVVRSPDSTRLWTYTGQGKARFGDREGFWGIHVPGDRAIVEVYSRNPVGRGAVALDGYARGYPAGKGGPVLGEPEAICGADDSQWAQCYAGSEPNAYDKARAVARLLIGGTSACTGWLVGSGGHLMTNNHCISTASSANNTDYEFMAEGSCAQDCASWGACPGTIAATSGTLVKTNAPLDYTLIALPGSPQSTYGFLQMRSAGAVLNERIYIPQHAAAWGKQIALVSGAAGDGGFCRATSLNATPCSGGPGDVGYMCDTQGGSSGSPVLAYGDNAVVSLHHCANCPNRGVPIQAVISDLGASLPPNATVGGTPPPTCGLPGSTCSTNGQCCSGSCKGKPGRKVCK